MNYAVASAFALAFFVLVLTGCTAHGLVGPLPTLSDPEQAAEIVVIREWRYIGGGANFTVVLDGVPLYGIAVDEHVLLRVPPGDHIVTISRRGPSLNDAAVAIHTEPRGATTTGWRRARGRGTSVCFLFLRQWRRT